MKAGTIQEAIFTQTELVAVGSFLDVYTPYAVNGTIHSISVGSNNFVNIGSLAFYFSGTDNSVEQDLILRIRAGSIMKTFYPLTTQSDNQGVTISVNSGNWTNIVGNAPIRIVGSGLNDGQSGTYAIIRYI